ncbi:MULTISPECIES: DUF6689 family protein [Pseudoxanthomonas]|uniref:Uncharacterized protein n=1 Tax=Pseudoxanthomonas winnipegensis TaxID=2480810 RepID=A0AAW8G966_9GAMM|nr:MULTISPECIES: DUF6689 family protein [Pseudoxanthomonas]MDQ1118432.1 hypothetical protein [Pseudoxanthomonas winnipegensis]MDQ1131616.1 hypothetical protein [Pseudoxanthomonas winnipegensis]MDR6138368.1 hypothetical protein [Pseudoxanthomonas sp. SORGH_AS_0997]
MTRFPLFASRLLLVAGLLLSGAAAAQTVPVNVAIAGDTATVAIGAPNAPLADLTINFDQASNLSAENLGISARLLSGPELGALTARLPGTVVQPIQPLPLLITVEPPVAGGLSFKKLVRVELHTHVLPYTAGSTLRLFKAPLGGAFRDITDEISPGSVRSRGTTDGFSQFLLVSDLRPTHAVVADKLSKLREQVDALPPPQAGPLDGYLDTITAALAAADFTAATVAVDSFRERVSAQAGTGIPQVWSAGDHAGNPAGALLAGAATLRFSIDYQRLYDP